MSLRRPLTWLFLAVAFLLGSLPAGGAAAHPPAVCVVGDGDEAVGGPRPVADAPWWLASGGPDDADGTASAVPPAAAAPTLGVLAPHPAPPAHRRGLPFPTGPPASA